MATTSTTVRVRYPETDRMDVAWHGHYLAWFETGRTEWMRAAGIPYRELEDRFGLHFPVVEAGVRYRSPSRYDEALRIESTMVHRTGVRVRFEYRLIGADDGRLRATGFTMHAAVDNDGRPRRLPAAVVEKLEAFGGEP